MISNLCIGTMSGTSMDGIDVALIQTNGEHQIEFIESYSLSYTKAQQQLLQDFAMQAHHHQGQLPSLVSDAVIALSTQLHGDAIEALLEKSRKKPIEIRVVGYHGQTVYHNAQQGLSIQIGDGPGLAKRLGIPVVYRFRENDLKAGGQGAPLAPLFHYALAMKSELALPIAVVNCGGIANISLIQSKQIEDVLGFDTGPGNVLIDRFVAKHRNETMDKDGQYGLQGQVHFNLLEKMWANRVRKKSLDTHDLLLLPEFDQIEFVDACRTLEAYTAYSIVKSTQELDVQKPKIWVLAGGGWYNPVIKQALIDEIHAWCGQDVMITTADELGWYGQQLEAQMFAHYAMRHVLQKPISYPQITQVSKPTIGGIYCEPN